MGKKTLLYIGLYLCAVVVVAAVSYIAAGRYLGVPLKLPILSSFIPKSLMQKYLPAVTPSPAVKHLAVTKSSIQEDNSIMYEIYGHFVNKLRYENNILRGEFIIDGDSTKNQIPVIIAGRGAQVIFGKFKGSYKGDVSWSRTPVDTIQEEIEPLETVYMRVIFSNKPENAPGINRITETLDSLSEGNPVFYPQFGFQPKMIGVVG